MHQGGKGSGAGATGASGAGASGSGDDSSTGIPLALTQLMEQNYSILTQFKSNMAAFKVMENTELLVRYRDNLIAIQQQLSSVGGTMGQMPPIPVQPNFELANRFLPTSTFKLPSMSVGAQTVAMAAAATAAAVASTAVGAVGPMPGVGMSVTGTSSTAPQMATAPVGPIPGASTVVPQPAVAAPTPSLPLLPPFPFNPAAAAGLGPAEGIPPGMPPADSFFGAAAGLPGALGVMPPTMMPGALNPAAAMGTVLPGAQFPFALGTPGMLGCMPMTAAAAPAPTVPDAGAAAVAAAAAAAAAAQPVILPGGIQSSMVSAPSMSRQGSAVQPLALPVAVKQESGT
ncbi:hypothetical protein Vafri_899 [Volvox africanus]|nr:hypothetical protein Vafri_899 [Volvox africanus]